MLDIERARVLYDPDLPIGPYAIPPRYRPHATLLEDLPFAPVSINTYGTPERMRPLADTLRARLPAGVGLIQTGSVKTWGVEVFVANVSKALGLRTIAARLGIEREEVMAVGDHIDDLEMIAWADRRGDGKRAPGDTGCRRLDHDLAARGRRWHALSNSLFWSDVYPSPGPSPKRRGKIKPPPASGGLGWE